MKIIVVGGGPAGLYFSLLAKKRFPGAEIDVYEQNPKDATYGFGIILADNGLHRLQKADSESCEAIIAACFMTRHRLIKHPEESVFVDGGGYGGAIERLRLLQILEYFCTREGVRIHYETRIESIGDLDAADLVVGADGSNSALRNSGAEEFGTTYWELTNRLAWYGTTQHFPYPMLSFKKCEYGNFVAAAYPYTERMGTFVAECDAETWHTSGLDRMSDEERTKLAEEVFADELGGHPLISNKSTWNTLPVIRNKEWFVGNRVLIGDALHNAHPSIGSGTRIAMEDSIALFSALDECDGDVATALPLFREVREPQKQKMVFAAEKSFCWYESFGSRMQTFSSVNFVFDFLVRTGRIDLERLHAEYPRFVKNYAERWTMNGPVSMPKAAQRQPAEAAQSAAGYQSGIR